MIIAGFALYLYKHRWGLHPYYDNQNSCICKPSCDRDKFTSKLLIISKDLRCFHIWMLDCVWRNRSCCFPELGFHTCTQLEVVWARHENFCSVKAGAMHHGPKSCRNQSFLCSTWMLFSLHMFYSDSSAFQCMFWKQRQKTFHSTHSINVNGETQEDPAGHPAFKPLKKPCSCEAASKIQITGARYGFSSIHRDIC